MPRGARRVLVIGSGIAGLYVALRARERGLRPLLVTKSRLEESNTRYAQGGIAAALGPDDSPARHLADTIRAGDGLVDREAAKLLTHEATARIADLVRYGVPFDTVEGQIALGREAAHSRARILHAGGDATGLQIEETLKARLLAAGIDARERRVLRLLRSVPDRPLEAIIARDDGSDRESWTEGPVVLATGGAGHLYRESSNPSVATGEGIAIAFRAGALVSDMEFVQFHPTVFYRDGAPRFLISEAVRGEGAVLRNGRGERFLPAFHPDAELAPRDVVSRAIRFEMDRTGARCVYLDATAVPSDRFHARFPMIARFLASYNLDPSKDLIPVTPAAHYLIGGVTTDLDGRSSLPGLFACGEVAATGVHGANRLASNSLLEGLVFGEHVVRQLDAPWHGGPTPPRSVLSVEIAPGHGHDEAASDLDTVRTTLWDSVGIVRDRSGLSDALETFEQISAASEPISGDLFPPPGANAALTARLIATAALTRVESRGTHFRSDFPEHKAAWRRHIGLRRTPAAPSKKR
jgi:L-aspartate oxidase